MTSRGSIASLPIFASARHCRHRVGRIRSRVIWKGYIECHIGPDWLLVYRVTAGEVLLARTGTHSDLFSE